MGGDDNISNSRWSSCSSPKMSTSNSSKSKHFTDVVLSDEEDEMLDNVDCSKGRLHKGPKEDVATSDGFMNKFDPFHSACELEAGCCSSHSKCATSSCTPVNLEESTCSYKSRSPRVAAQNGNDFRSSSIDEVSIASIFSASGSKCEQYVPFKIENDLVHSEADSCMQQMALESKNVSYNYLYCH